MSNPPTDVSEDEFVGSVAKRVSSKDEFLELVKLLAKNVEEFEEFGERSAVEFLTVIYEKLEFAREFSGVEDIELPDEPSWSWLARLFVVGALDN